MARASPHPPAPAPAAALPAATEISYSEYTQLAPSEISLNRRWYNRINTWTHAVRPASRFGGGGGGGAESEPSMQSLPGTHTVLAGRDGDDETVAPGESASQAGARVYRPKTRIATKQEEKLPALPPAPVPAPPPPPAPRLARQESIASRHTMQTLSPDQSVSARQTPAGSFRHRPLPPQEGEEVLATASSREDSPRHGHGQAVASAHERALPVHGLTTEELKQQRLTWQRGDDGSKRASRVQVKVSWVRYRLEICSSHAPAIRTSRPSRRAARPMRVSAMSCARRRPTTRWP